MSHTLYGLSTASILCDSAPLLCPERALLEAVTAPPPDARSSRATYTQWKCPDGSAAAGGCDSSEKSGRPESNEYPTRRAQEYAAPPRPKYAARKKTKWPWVIASSVAAHKLTRASENAVGGGGQRDGRRGAPPTASKQVLGGEGGGGAADVRGVDRPGLAAGRVGYAEATGRDVNSGRGPPRQRGRPPGLLRPA